MRTISISQSATQEQVGAPLTIQAVASIFAEHGVSCDVRPKVSVVNGTIEAGADITVYDDGAVIAQAFLAVSRAFNLKCAWVTVEFDGVSYEGCSLKAPAEFPYGNTLDAAPEPVEEPSLAPTSHKDLDLWAGRLVYHTATPEHFGVVEGWDGTLVAVTWDGETRRRFHPFKHLRVAYADQKVPTKAPKGFEDGRHDTGWPKQ